MGGFVLVVAVALAGSAFARVASARRAEAAAERERDRLRTRIARDVGDVAAHEALGDSLRAAGRMVEARDAYRMALAAGQGRLRDEPLQYKVRQIDLALSQRQSGRPDSDWELILCPGCGATNAPRTRVCETCTVTLPYATFREALGDKELRRATVESAACVLVLLAALAAFSAQPLDVKGALIMATLIVAAWRFLQAIGPRSY